MDALERLLSIHQFRYPVVSANYAGTDQTAILIDNLSIPGGVMLLDLYQSGIKLCAIMGS